MIYVGNNTFLHCTGSSFVYNSDPSTSRDQATSTERNNGAIQTLSVDDVFVNTGSDRYLFSAENTSFAVLRPLARAGLELTEQATLRAFIPDIVIEKTATTPHMSTVTRGEDITYSITLINKGTSTYNNLVIYDVISALCSYKADTINNDGAVVGNNVTWNVTSLDPLASITLSYTVTVNNDAPIGSVIESYSGTVNGVLTNKIYHTIGGFSASDYSNLISAADSLIGLNYDGDTSDGFKVAIDLYYNAFGYYFVNSSTTASNIDNSLIYSNRANNTIDTTSQYYPLVNPNFYGGLLIKSGFVTDNLRIRNNKSSYFEPGDIIVETDNHSGIVKKTYIYISNDKIIGLDGSNDVTVLYATTDDVNAFLSQMIGYHRYVVLRPALAYYLD